VDEIYLTHPFAGIVRAKDGKTQFRRHRRRPQRLRPPSASPAPSAKSALPLVTIDSLHIDNADVSVEDFVPPTPVKTKLLPIHLKLDHLSTAPAARNPYSFTAKSDAGETFQWDGLFSLEPLQVSGSFQIAGLDLKRYSPLSGPVRRGGITDGKLTWTPDYAASLGTNGPDLSLKRAASCFTSLLAQSRPTERDGVDLLPPYPSNWPRPAWAKKLLHLTLLKTPTVRCSPAKTGRNHQPPFPAQAGGQTARASPRRQPTPWTVMVDEIAVDRYNVALEDRKPAKPAKFNLAKSPSMPPTSAPSATRRWPWMWP
jgi:hypothetical protein